MKQATGSSCAAFLTARRMREARTLLLGGRGVAEAAREVGYRSPTSFSAAFAKAFGMSPSQFKDRSAMAVVNVASETNRQALPKVGRHGDRRHIR
ncbi:helix-turn-helix transcriptional regulator [uncultured Enorma sp.]|uniref:helix-turn-helix transcriptional regulator n=1 Tax=uncultured Enorma sp. TaxID=1714346 RepID=UPI0035A649DE